MSPQVVLLFSGKRKSGKDYLTDHLKNLLTDKCEIIKISRPIKSHWAKEKNLNLNELMSDSAYKEQYRLEMIKWGEDIRRIDYGYFCKAACASATERDIWIVSDIRRKTDVKWFKETYGNRIRLIRVNADEDTRKARGFEFISGLDDAMSECDLDDFQNWDLIINNGEGSDCLDAQLDSVLKLANL